MKRLLTVLFFVTALFPAWADSAREIDAKVDTALDRFRQEVPSADRVMASAHAVLVIPKVIKGGLLIGGEYGEGSLRMGGRTVEYYNVASASIGLTAGGQMKDIIVLFLSESALEKFRKSSGWEAGVDGNIAVIQTGAGASVDVTKIKEPIVAFVVGVQGLMVDASLKGSKFSEIKK